MSSVDNRVVNMEFNNQDFANKIGDTIQSLQRLEDSLKFEQGKENVAGVEQSINNMDFSGIETGINSLKSRFSTLGIVGMTVIQNLTNGFLNFGRSLGSKIISGGISRAMNIEQAKFMIEGLGESWDKLYTDMDNAVSGTAYGIDAAAKAASQFAASGIKASAEGGKMGDALKAISGVAAMTGSSYDEIANVFTKVAGQGRLMGDDLLSMASRGMNAAADLAKAMGKTEEEIRDMVSKGKISFEDFIDVMGKYGDHAKEANKTFSGSLSNVNAALSRLGQAFITPLIKTKEAGDETYNLVDVLNTFRSVIDNVKNHLADWGIIDKTVEKGKKSITVVGSFTKAIQKASLIVTRFLDILAGETTDENGTKSVFFKLEMLRQALGMSEKDFQNLTDTVNGVFSIFKIIGKLITSVVNAIFPMGDAAKDAGSGLLAITGAIGRYITNIEQAIDDSELFERIFSAIGTVVSYASKGISYFAGKIGELFSNLGNGNTGFLNFFVSTLDAISKKLKPLGNIVNNVFGSIKETLDGIFDSIGKALSGADFDKITSFLSLGLTGGVGVSLITILNNLNRTLNTFFNSFSKGLHIVDLSPLEKLRVSLQGILSDFDAGVRADTLTKMAKAIALLAGSLFLLSIIKPERLAVSLLALQALLGDMVGMLTSLDKFSTKLNAFKAVSIGASIMELSASFILLAAAVKILSTMSLEDLAKGLGAVGVLLLELDLFMMKASGFKGRTVKKAASAMLKMSVALLIMAEAVKRMGALSLEELARGLVGLGVVLAEFAAFMYLTKGLKVGAKSAVGLLIMSAALLVIGKAITSIAKLNPEKLARGLVGLGAVLLELAAFVKITSGSKGILTASVGMLVLSEALKGLTGTIKELGNFSEEQMAKGLLMLAGSLVIIAGAMRAMPKNMVVVSAGLFIAAQAISSIAEAMSSMGGMSAEGMAKSLIMMAGSLTILAIAMHAMNGALAGAAAMLVVGAALALLAPPLKVLGEMSLQQIVLALVAMAGAFAVLGVAGTLLGPVLPVIIGLTGALALMGVAMISAGVGVTLFVTALGIFSANIDAFVKAIPEFLNAIASMAAAIGQTAVTLIMALLEVIAGNIERFVTLGIDIVTGFINGISSRLDDIIDAGFNLAIGLINGLASGIEEHGTELRAAIAHLLGSIIDFVLDSIQTLLKNLPGGAVIAKAIDPARKALKNFFGDGSINKETKKGTDTMAKSVDQGTSKAYKSAKKNTDKISDSVKKSANKAGKAYNGIDKLIGNPFLEVAKKADVSKDMKKSADKSGEAYKDGIKKTKGVKDAGEGLGKDASSGAGSNTVVGWLKSGGGSVGQGYVNGIEAKWDDAYRAGFTLGSKAKQGEKDATKHSSPSKVFDKAGRFVGQGYVNGISKFFDKAYEAGNTLGQSSIAGANRATSKINGMFKDPVIRPVLDLSNVKMGANSINSMFRNRYALGLAGSVPSSMRSSRPQSMNISATFNVNGADNPREWADEFVQELEIQARTYNG